MPQKSADDMKYLYLVWTLSSKVGYTIFYENNRVKCWVPHFSFYLIHNKVNKNAFQWDAYHPC